MINCWEEDVKIEPGVVSEAGGKYAFISLERATYDLKEGYIDALVTAPINKDNIQSDKFNFPGHTEYLQDARWRSRIVNVFGERYLAGWCGYRPYPGIKNFGKHHYG
jgi:4-hydroxy-L-threonine phosphate dehydrogenase PdxA